MGADRRDARPDGDLVTTDRVARDARGRARRADHAGRPPRRLRRHGRPAERAQPAGTSVPGRLRRTRQLSIRRARCRRAASGGGCAGLGGVRVRRRRNTAVPGHGPGGDLGVGNDVRNRRRGRAPSRDQPRGRGHEPAGVTVRRGGRRRAAAARRRRNVRRVVADVPRHHRRAEPARRSPARARGRRRCDFGPLSKGSTPCSMVGERGSPRRQSFSTARTQSASSDRRPARDWPNRPR